MKPKILLTLSLLAALLFVTAANLPAQQTQLTNADITVVRVYFDDVADFYALSAETDIWAVDHAAMYFETGATAAEIAAFEAQGLRVEVDVAHTADVQQVERSSMTGIPGYPCYRTVEETFVSAEILATNFPHLARWIDIGDSWEKLNASEGYDLRVLQITNFERDPADKPKLMLTSAIHAREYTTAELNMRFAEMLVNGYGVDADITWILDYHDIHLVLQANPDGRKIAETGVSKRKNMNANFCGTSTTNRGIDLNRNFPFEWGQHNGSSGSVCSATYRGPAAGSEPETAAIVEYMRDIFPDQRDDDATSPAPDDATGLYIDIHSYSELVLWPWGFPGVAPNGTALQTLGRKLAYFNGYEPQQSVDLYPTDGTTVDTVYGELGVAAFTFELGTRFFESCSLFESTILPDNLPALLYAAKVARAPYLLAAGPDVVDLTTSQKNLLAGETFSVNALITDTRFNMQNGSEPTQPIVAANVYFDRPSWEAGATAQPMTASDGTFDSRQESVELTLTAPMQVGTYTLFVEGIDANGNVGATSAVSFNVVPVEQPNSFVISAPTVNAEVGEPFGLPVSISNVPNVFVETITVTATFDEAILSLQACDLGALPMGSCSSLTTNTVQYVAHPQAEVSDFGLFSLTFVGLQPTTTTVSFTSEILDADDNVLTGVALNSTVDVVPARLLLPLLVK